MNYSEDPSRIGPDNQNPGWPMLAFLAIPMWHSRPRLWVGRRPIPWRCPRLAIPARSLIFWTWPTMGWLIASRSQTSHDALEAIA